MSVKPYTHLKKGYMVKPFKFLTPEEIDKKFFSKCKKVTRGKFTGCWVWKGARHREKLGYGHFHANGKKFYAHRASYALFKGDIPAGLLVRHSCDNHNCANPLHLFLGTQADNMRDYSEKIYFQNYKEPQELTADIIETPF